MPTHRWVREPLEGDSWKDYPFHTDKWSLNSGDMEFYRSFMKGVGLLVRELCKAAHALLRYWTIEINNGESGKMTH